MDRSLLRRGAARAPDLPPQRVPGLRRGRDRGAALPLDGVRGRRGSRLAPAADREAPGRQGGRDRAAALRGTGGGARSGRSPPGPEARQRHARRAGPRPNHGLRPRRSRRRRQGGRRSRRHSRLHGARATRRQGRLGPERSLRPGPRPLRALHGEESLRGGDRGRMAAQALAGAAHGAFDRHEGARPGRRARDPALPGEGAGPEAALGRRRGRGSARRRSARRRHRGGRDPFSRDGRRGRQQRRDEARGGVGLSGLDPRGTGSRRLSLSACLPSRARAAGETSGRARREVEGDRPEARLYRKTRRYRHGAFPATGNTAAGSRSTTNRKTAGKGSSRDVRRRFTSGIGRVPLRSSRSDSAATTPAR